MKYRVFYLPVISLFVFLGLAVFMLEQCKPKKDVDETVTAVASEPDYVGDKACQACHAKEHADWQLSDHKRAMEPANDSTVLGDFNNARYTADGVTTRFYKKDGRFYLETTELNGDKAAYEVLYTFGFKPLQQYLVAFPGGRMQVTRVSWDTDKKKWFHQYKGDKLHPTDWLHWTKGGQNWNTMCASCHSTNLKKGYDAVADTFHTTYSAIHVSCESCHGPGSKHAAYAGSEAYGKGDRVPGSFLRSLKNDTLAAFNSCMPCHARKTGLDPDPVFSRELMDHFIPEIPRTEYFHADGQQDDEDFIYTSFVQSKMYHRGVTCKSCHNPHSGKLIAQGNAMCRSCHEPKYEAFEHTGHQSSLTQVTCVSCHMPGKFYMENDYRHDHSFRVPRPDLSVKYGTPNACNSCHQNKPAQWAADAVVKWFGPIRKYHFSEDLVPGSKGDPSSLHHLKKLSEDTSVPSIIQATAVYYLEQVPGNMAFSILQKALAHKDPQVRYRALNNLDAYPFKHWTDIAGPLLSDKVRAVRIAAADLFLNVPVAQIPNSFREPFSKAKSELQQYLQSQLDFAVGNLGMADFYMKQQDYANAERYYLRGLKQDSMMNYARLNLSSMYNAQRRNQDALRILQEASQTDPKNGRVNYQLGLLLAEMNQVPDAEEQFRKAIANKYNDPRIYYNYGIIVQQQGKAKEAEKIFRSGLAIEPEHQDLNYALVFLLLQLKRERDALAPAMILKKISPGNPDYQPLFQRLGI
jgi:predicted CXXCH cytochrome family protein